MDFCAIPLGIRTGALRIELKANEEKRHGKKKLSLLGLTYIFRGVSRLKDVVRPAQVC